MTSAKTPAHTSAWSERTKDSEHLMMIYSSEKVHPIKKKIKKRSEADEGCILIPPGSDTVRRAWRRLNIIDGLCNCGGYPGPISFQVIRQKDKPNMVCSVQWGIYPQNNVSL